MLSRIAQPWMSAAALLSVLPLLAAENAVRYDAGTISGLSARNIGSAQTSGRIAAVDAVNEDGRLTVFAGAASGGVWKSVNGGSTFKPVFIREGGKLMRDCEYDMRIRHRQQFV